MSLVNRRFASHAKLHVGNTYSELSAKECKCRRSVHFAIGYSRFRSVNQRLLDLHINTKYYSLASFQLNICTIRFVHASFANKHCILTLRLTSFNIVALSSARLPYTANAVLDCRLPALHACFIKDDATV